MLIRIKINTIIIYFQRKVCKKILKEKIESQSKIFFLNFELKNFQFFNSPPFPKHSQLGRTWYPTPPCAASVWLMGRFTTLLVTKHFMPNLYLGKLTISLGVASILDYMFRLLATSLSINSGLILNKSKSWMFLHPVNLSVWNLCPFALWYLFLLLELKKFLPEI